MQSYDIISVVRGCPKNGPTTFDECVECPSWRGRNKDTIQCDYMNYCPKCGHHPVLAYVMMFTVSYECPKCGYTWGSPKQEKFGN